MSARRRLPDCRLNETRDMIFRGQLYHLTISRFEDGSLAEMFLNAEKASTDSADDARDAALCLSIGLQYGMPAEVIRKAVTRASDGTPAGVIGAALDLLASDDGE